MTGYARAQGADDLRRWVWEARSVNGRNLEVRCRVPQGFERLENPARTAAGAKLRRGNISLSLTVASERSSKPLRINRALLGELSVLVAEMRQAGATAPSADGLLRVRGVIEEEEQGEESEEALVRLDKALSDTLDAALKALASARAAEGKALATVISGHVDEIEGLCTRAAERAQAQIGTVRARFQTQLAELLDRAPALSEERFAQEVALLVGKADVREELDRLSAHVAQARTLLAEARPDNPVGRKFDFLCQEFNREANTLCSKSADIELTRIGIDLKGAIERMREQVQNVE
ncbi:TIGR00255 family protein [Enhydrobacter aerosaccus]|uniref:TIGR00255 family protein n=1 Tax=Enhydrobacter aerosaccus TaxID=225324 RepID=A0A1T4KHQ3_9HYPH|nr:YicC/YloC family endoribonuclease [Enhydrobacter aerosaccus]SJZ41950.1 TIGR00255 family protein [Enhydrobacter aerosaccus]